jgi:hypothetical protein
LDNPGASEGDAAQNQTVMFRPFLAVAILAGVPTLTQAQSASAPLIVTATVVSTCTVDVPSAAEPVLFSTLPVGVTCARGGAAPRVQRPSRSPRRVETHDALLLVNF